MINLKQIKNQTLKSLQEIRKPIKQLINIFQMAISNEI